MSQRFGTLHMMLDGWRNNLQCGLNGKNQKRGMAKTSHPISALLNHPRQREGSRLAGHGSVTARRTHRVTRRRLYPVQRTKPLLTAHSYPCFSIVMAVARKIVEAILCNFSATSIRLSRPHRASCESWLRSGVLGFAPRESSPSWTTARRPHSSGWGGGA